MSFNPFILYAIVVGLSVLAVILIFLHGIFSSPEKKEK